MLSLWEELEHHAFILPANMAHTPGLKELLLQGVHQRVWGLCQTHTITKHMQRALFFEQLPTANHTSLDTRTGIQDLATWLSYNSIIAA